MCNIILKVNKMCSFASSFTSALHNFARINLTVSFRNGGKRSSASTFWLINRVWKPSSWSWRQKLTTKVKIIQNAQITIENYVRKIKINLLMKRENTCLLESLTPLILQLNCPFTHFQRFVSICIDSSVSPRNYLAGRNSRVTVRGQDRKFSPNPRTNQIARFAEFRLFTSCEKIKS